MPQRGLPDLPVEILIQILRLLQLRDLICSRAICRTLRDTVKRTLELQYIIELAADDLVDGSWRPGSLTTAARLELLLDRRRRWRQLDWVKMETISLPGTCQAYEMVDGVFAKSTGGFGLDGWSGSKHLIMTWLPSRTQETHSIIREDLGIFSRDFAIDPAQDLIALVVISESAGSHLQIKVHLRTMSQNTPHPQAPTPCLSASIPFQVGSCFVQIVDDVVGMFFWVHGPGFVIWNWRTGEKLVVRHEFDVQRFLLHAPPPLPQERTNELPPGTWDFAFISARAFVLTTTDGSGSIELFTFDATPSSTGERLPPRHVASLRLPTLKAGREINSFTTHSAPFLAYPASRDVPFAPNQDERVHALSVRYGDRDGLRVLMIMKNSFLMSFISSDSAHGAAGKQPEKVTLPWEEWGPENTRFSDCTIRSSWLRYVHGQRIVLPEWPFVPPAETDQPLQSVCVMDFNVHPKRIDDPCMLRTEGQSPVTSSSSSRGSPLGTYEIVCEPTVLPKGDLFTEDILSRLPYSVSTRSFSADYTGFMIDEERLVGMKQMAFAEFGAPSDRDMDIFVF